METMPVVNLSYASRERPQFDPRALIAMGPQISIDILPPSIVEKWAQIRKVSVKKTSKVTALLDSGASVTGIDDQVLTELQYPPIGIAGLSTPSGTRQTNMYMVKLVIPSRSDPNFPPIIPRIIIDNVRVISVTLSNQPYKALLGRDVLSKMIMIYNGPHALITLGY